MDFKSYIDYLGRLKNTKFQDIGNLFPILQPYVNAYVKVQALLLANKIGMIIPKNVNINQYYMNNLIMYGSVLNRNVNVLNKITNLNILKQYGKTVKLKILMNFTDKELFELFELDVAYLSRLDLVIFLYKITESPEIVFPFIPRINRKRNQLKGSNEVILAIGTITPADNVQYSLSMWDTHFARIIQMVQFNRLIQIVKDSNYSHKFLYQLFTLLSYYPNTKNLMVKFNSYLTEKSLFQKSNK